MKLNTEDWYYYGQWEQRPFQTWFWVHWFDEDIVRKTGVEINEGKIMMLNGHTLASQTEIQTARKQIRNACAQKNKALFDQIVGVTDKILEEHLELGKAVEKSGDDIDLFKKFLSSSKKVHVPWTIAVYFSDMVGDLLVERAQTLGISAIEILDYIEKKETLQIKQHREALEMQKELHKRGLLDSVQKPEGLDIVKKTPLWNRIEKHMENYAWVGTHHFWGEPLSLGKFLNELPTLKEAETKAPRNVEALPDELRFLTEVAADMMFIRQYIPEIFDLVAFKARPLMNRIAKKIGVNYDDMLLLTPREVMMLVERKGNAEKNVIERRKSGFGMLHQQGQDVIIDDPHEFESVMKQFVPVHNEGVNELKGAVANAGSARGPVKIFLIPENLSKMKVGDVLIAPMTTPDFIPIMHKAAAIVTDVGGLLSHAAIVSREMGKPCIVGTKSATKVFKDGDLVEVDANNGIVRRVK